MDYTTHSCSDKIISITTIIVTGVIELFGYGYSKIITTVVRDSVQNIRNFSTIKYLYFFYDITGNIKIKKNISKMATGLRERRQRLRLLLA